MKEIKINAKLIFSLFVIAIGILFYLAWNIKYHAWTDIGIYSVTVILVSFGILGSMLSISR